MAQKLGYVALLVHEYDEAIEFFKHTLGFQLIEDAPAKDRLGQDKRWVLMAPPGWSGASLFLRYCGAPKDLCVPWQLN